MSVPDLVAADFGIFEDGKKQTLTHCTRPPVVTRVTTELVQVDAVVLDKKGQHVTDLTVDDFEIIEGGKPQPITHCARLASAEDNR